MSFGTFEEIDEQARAADQFDGEITIDEEVDDNFNTDRTRWHYGVTPDGSEKTIQAWYNNGARGQMAQVVASLRKHVPAEVLKGKKPGQGNLLGIRGTFERKAFTYTDRESGERRESRNLTIVMVRYAGQASAQPAYSKEDISAMLALVHEQKPSAYQRLIMKDKDLSGAAKSDLLSGKALDWLVSNGYATRDGEVLTATDKAEDIAWVTTSS